MAGIRNNGTGFDRFVIEPYLPEDLNQMRIATESVYGKIVSNYERVGKGVRFNFTIPEGSQATIIIPLAQGNEALVEDGQLLEAGQNGIINVNYQNGIATIVVGSGSYTFDSGSFETEDSTSA